MELWVLLLLAAWLLVTVTVTAACAAAARGDVLLREATEAARDAHWAPLRR